MDDPYYLPDDIYGLLYSYTIPPRKLVDWINHII